MCGIAGSVNAKDKDALERMLDSIAHRGPDDVGSFYDDGAQVALGHRRLSIIDLTAAGHQPMSNESGSVWITYNGEIYNYKQLAKELAERGYVFRSTSDTEVLIHGYEAYGSDIFKKIDGMWAIALYDTKQQKLLLSRDPAGMKPLYFYHEGDMLLFASEIGALTPLLPARARALRHGALKRFLLHGYIYGEETIYQGIQAVPPATTITISLPALTLSSERHYLPKKGGGSKSLPEAVEAFERIFEVSVEQTLQADVPVALFLSGGIDSALVGRSLQKRGAHLQSFTIGFEDHSFDESNVAQHIARALGFPHTTIPMRAADVADDIGAIFDSFGQPFADMSMLPTYYLSKHAHAEGYKVALTGDGADELFGGYPTHFLPTLTSLYRRTPHFTDAALKRLTSILPGRFSKLGTKEKLARFLYGAREHYRDAHAMWKHVFTENELQQLVLPAHGTALADQDASFREYFASFTDDHDAGDAVMKVDFMTFLPASCLVKSDICAMQHSLELRMPFLNKPMIDLASNLPARLKVSAFQTKKVLRAALSRDLPRTITTLPKQGFVPPLSLWLTKELKPAMLDMLSRERVVKTGFLDYTYTSFLIEEHFARRKDNAKKLWALMSLVRFLSRP